MTSVKTQAQLRAEIAALKNPRTPEFRRNVQSGIKHGVKSGRGELFLETLFMIGMIVEAAG